MPWPREVWATLTLDERYSVDQFVPLQLVRPELCLDQTPCEDNIELLSDGLYQLAGVDLEELVPSDLYLAEPFLSPQEYDAICPTLTIDILCQDPVIIKYGPAVIDRLTRMTPEQLRVMTGDYWFTLVKHGSKNRMPPNDSNPPCACKPCAAQTARHPLPSTLRTTLNDQCQAFYIVRIFYL